MSFQCYLICYCTYNFDLSSLAMLRCIFHPTEVACYIRDTSTGAQKVLVYQSKSLLPPHYLSASNPLLH